MGQPAPAAHRPRAPVTAAIRANVERDRRRRPDRADPRAYIVKEELRALLSLAGRRPTRGQISNAKYRFGAWCASFANVPELLTLAETIAVWWPETEAFLRLNITKARTEGSNRTIKQLKRVGCGFANQPNYERRILAYATARNAA